LELSVRILSPQPPFLFQDIGILITTFLNWDDAKPGFVEAYLVDQNVGNTPRPIFNTEK